MPPVPPSQPVPRSNATLVILLGASNFQDPNFTSSPTFANVAAGIRNYFRSPTGFGLHDPAHQFLQLFDLDREPNEHLTEIARFIAAGRQHSPAATDLIIWYVGHGTFDHRGNYCLTINRTRDLQRGSSSIRMTDLANLLVSPTDGVASDLRTYLIIDACYSGNAPGEFMGGDDVRLAESLSEELPRSGVAALCSAPADKRSYFDTQAGTTVFSGAILDFLATGASPGGKSLHLADVYAAAVQRIMRHKDLAKRVRPVLHDPKSDEGDVSRVPIFPNPWRTGGPGKRRFKAVLFDLDGTLLVGYQYSWSLIWKMLGYPDDLRKDLLRQFQRGEITYAEWCQKCCDYFRKGGLNRKHLSKKFFKERGIRVVNNFGRVMRALDERGMLRGIVSGGIDTFLNLLPRTGNFRHVFINKFHYDKSGLLRYIEPTPYDHEQKWDGLLEFCRLENIDPKEVVFVGDSINDKEIAARSQLSIAFSGSSQGELKGVVDKLLAKNDLRYILDIIQDKENDTPSLPFEDSSASS